MNNRLVIGAIAGMSALTLAVPVFAQVSTSSSSASSIAANFFRGPREPLTQEQVQELVARDEALLMNLDEIAATIKSTTQTHHDALVTAAAISDETARNDAVKAAHEARHTSMRAAIEANPEWKGAIPFGGKMKMMHRMHRGGPGHLAEKLGMTPEELKAAIEAGKSIEEIAEEKGVELPERPIFRMKLDAEAISN